MDPLLERGQLPFIEDLVRGGARGRLLSTIPYASIPAWPSFMTGKNPGKHGVFDFFSYSDGQRRISTSQDIHSLTLWDILSVYGRRAVVMNVPATFPPAEINGVLVTGMLTPAGAIFVSPPEIREFLDQATGGYRINSRSDLSGSQLVEDLTDVTEKQKNGFVALLGNQAWDLAMIMFSATDVIQHHFWGKQDVVCECYRYMDRVVGEILRKYPDATIFLISDHGFQGQRKDFHVNKWLINQGYMHIRKRSQEAEASRFQDIGQLEGRAGFAQDSLNRLNSSQVMLRMGLTSKRLRRLVPQALWDALKRWVPKTLKRRIPASAEVAYEVDWECTQASAYQLYGMESKAIKLVNVDQLTRERLCAELVERLTALRDPQTGKRIVRHAYRREEIYVGAYVDQAPDIILDLSDGYNITNAFFAEDYVTQCEFVRGCHHREGIFIACGSDIASGKVLDQFPSLVDITPTILHYLGLSVPSDCDGRVLEEIFDTDSEACRREVLYEDMEQKDYITDGPLTYRADERAEIEERLRALGYL
jgi:predicted AlkP superfamily phosphohydrolase/phosphomutase